MAEQSLAPSPRTAVKGDDGLSPPATATPERFRIKKSRSVDLGKLGRRSADAHFIGMQGRRNADDYDSVSCSNRKFSANAKMAHALALGRCPPQPRCSSTMTSKGLLRHVSSSSSSNDLAALSASYEDYLDEYDFLSAPLTLTASRSSHNIISNPSNVSPSLLLSSSPLDSDTVGTSFIMKITGDKRRWTVGRISVFMLVAFTVTDFVLNAAGVHIRPTIGIVYVSDRSAHLHAHDRPQLSLGAAAISSITETLSPILPFTGGLDLRREDYWRNGIVGSITSVIVQVRDAFSQEQQATASTTKQHPVGRTDSHPSSISGRLRTDIKIKHAMSMSSPDPFVSTSKIADLTLGDLATVYQYSLESSRPYFDRQKFIKDVEPRVQDILGAFEKATAASRGTHVLPAITASENGVVTAGNMDALNFCAATRILAEWRIIRLVPDGHKGYAVGMNLGHKDVVQNLAKIEKALHALIDDRAAAGFTPLRSPTLFELLRHEIDTNVQDVSKLPRLRERSAGMGLLWVRRQLQYQSELFTKFLQVGERYDTTNEALNAAYTEVYGQFHGWAVQKIFSYSFQAAPDVMEIFKVMNPRKLREVSSSFGQGIDAGALAEKFKSPTSLVSQSPNPFEKAIGTIHNEWDKIATNVVGFFDDRFGKKSKKAKSGSPPSLRAAAATSTEIIAPVDQPVEEYIATSMADDARKNMRAYLAATQPILESLARLFDRLNMNDPSKV